MLTLCIAFSATRRCTDTFRAPSHLRASRLKRSLRANWPIGKSTAAAGGRFVWRESQELIGWCGLQFLPEFGETEVAYLLSRPYWGQGLATEAARAAAQFGFQTLGLERLVAIAHVENAASQRVIEKLGMSFVEQLSLWGIECYRYSLPRAAFAEWAST